ncbi:basic salivary proline-rich protein 2-like [Hyaena hyaena]|uniref:basic salivary proline-rich protein 2-like n=1 Tax=Hyaena hyaena TaxID=95912 RepID=UPI001923C05C|nr:basic salivary proline-rich protein 2-like [Hyaena hyaena]
METSRAKLDAPPPVYLKKSGGVGQGLRYSRQQGRPRGPAGLSRALTHPASRYKRGAPLQARGPEAGDPGTPGAEAGEPGSAGRTRPSAPPAALGLRGRARLAPSGRAPGRSRCPGLPTPPGLGSGPRHPPTRRTDQARTLPPRRAQREPDSGRGLPPQARRLRPRLARRPPPPPAAPHLPRAPRSHRPPAAPPPPPPAPGPSPPLRLPPQPAPPAPGSASRPRPLGASASGQARTGEVALWDGPPSGGSGGSDPAPGARIPPRPRPGASPRAWSWRPLRKGAAAVLRPTTSRPQSPRRPLLAGGGLRSGARPGAPGEERISQDPRRATTTGSLRPPPAQLSPSETLDPAALRVPSRPPNRARRGS